MSSVHTNNTKTSDGWSIHDSLIGKVKERRSETFVK